MTADPARATPLGSAVPVWAALGWAGILDAFTLAIAGATLFWYHEVSPALPTSVTVPAVLLVVLWVLPMTALQTGRVRPTWMRLFAVGLGAYAVPVAIATYALLTETVEEAAPMVLVGFTLLSVTRVARTAEMVRQSRNASHRDPLTRLANRRLFQDRVRLALADPDRTCGVMFIDLDDFKNINDSLGHSVGDVALAALARRIEETVRSSDVVARLGGDEFAVLVHDEPVAGLAALGERLVARVAEPVEVAGHRLHLHISVGIATADAGTDYDELIRDADVAMYAAKRAGKNRLAVFEGGMLEDRLDRLDLEAELRAAIDAEELTVVYQPIVDLRTGRVDGVEALVRWYRDGRLQPTQEMIQVAEETGLVLPLGRFVLRAAAAQARAWRRQGLQLNIGVNVSALQLGDPEFLDAAREAVAALGDELVLVLELTESTLVGGDRAAGLEDAVERLQELREIGCRIAIDDFGTGFSSLAYLTRLPVDILKLAGGLVTGVDRRDRDASVAAAVLGLASALDYLVVAEGVEHPEEAEELRRLGCTLGQGYHWARPASPEDLHPYLTTWGRRPGAPVPLPVAGVVAAG
ncbi:MAG: EAL domain-containing protein [Nocardioidaceae bacterium]|nr:EAL domain-containing protein [Nocardioidaceae bacterium]